MTRCGAALSNGGIDGGGEGGGGIAIGVVVAQMVNPPLTTEPSLYQLIVAPAAIATLVGTLARPLYRVPPMVMRSQYVSVSK